MSDQERMTDIETLARMAARLAGRDPDEHLKIALADIVPFDDVLWRYDDFLARAEAAYHALTTPSLTLPLTLSRQQHSATTESCRHKMNEGE